MNIQGPRKREKDSNHSFGIPVQYIEVLQKVYLLALLCTLLLTGYLLYGFFSGKMANAAGASTQTALHALALVQSISVYLNVSLLVTLILTVVLYWEEEVIAWMLLLLAVVFSYGITFSTDYFASSGAKLKDGPASAAALSQINAMAIQFAVAGGILFLKGLWNRLKNARYGHDLTDMQFGKEAPQEHNVPRALLGAAAKCWQLPYCRERLRDKCPIYHARTRCWKERVGCMCEENIVRLAMAGDDAPVNLGAGASAAGFVPIGDLIARSEKEQRPVIPTRQGPRGVRIPTNPHLSDAQKRQRCRTCIIYSEHQRRKYNLISPFVTLAVPVLTVVFYSNIQMLLENFLHNLDSLVANLQFAPDANPARAIAHDITGSAFIEGIIIFCLMLMVLSWTLRLLEYCIFTIQI